MPPNQSETNRQRETPGSTERWYQDMVKRLGAGRGNKTLQSDIGEFTGSAQVGSMYVFSYDPKLADVLPYYDTVPVVVPFRIVSDGFYGLNFHYLAPMLRTALLDRMIDLTASQPLTNTTRMSLTWRLLNNASRFPGVNTSVKRYLYSQIGSRLLKVYPKDWKKTILLPIDNFEKSSRTSVFRNSRSKI